MKKILLSLAIAFSMTACASTEYTVYAQAQADIAVAQARAEEVKYTQMALASKDNATAGALYMMAMAMGGNTKQATLIAAPESGVDKTLRLLGFIAAPLVQAYGINAGARTAIKTSQYSMELGKAQAGFQSEGLKSTNDTFGRIAGGIQAPAANVSTVNTTSNNDNHSINDAYKTRTFTNTYSSTTNTDNSNQNNAPAEVPK